MVGPTMADPPLTTVLRRIDPDGTGVHETTLLREMVDEGWTERRARAEYAEAKRCGDVFVVDGTVRVA